MTAGCSISHRSAQNFTVVGGMTGKWSRKEQKNEAPSQVIWPIICSGDAIGAVILMGREEKDIMGETEKKLVQTAAGFLGRQMEQ